MLAGADTDTSDAFENWWWGEYEPADDECEGTKGWLYEKEAKFYDEDISIRLGLRREK